jgi:hypothetical protein
MTDHLDDLSGNMRVAGGAAIYQLPMTASQDAAELVQWAAIMKAGRWEFEPRHRRLVSFRVRTLLRAALRIIMAHSRASTRKEAREVLERLG